MEANWYKVARSAVSTCYVCGQIRTPSGEFLPPPPGFSVQNGDTHAYCPECESVAMDQLDSDDGLTM